MKKLFSITFLVLSLSLSAVMPWMEGSFVPGNERTLYTAELFVPFCGRPNNFLFFDARAYLDSRREIEGNVGLGYRVLCGDRFILGANGFFDIRRSRGGNTYKQLSFGLEWMSSYIELRGNVYLAETGKDVAKVRRLPGEIVEAIPQGNNVLLKILQNREIRYFERPLRGYDLEGGLRLPLFIPSIQLWLYGGGYCYSATGVRTHSGPRGRLEFEIQDPLRCMGYFGTRLTLEAIVQSDSVRNTEAFFAVRFAFPLYDCPPTCSCGLAERMGHRVVRNEQMIIARLKDTELHEKEKEELLLNSKGDPLRIIYCNGLGGGNGEGTFENPFTEFSDTLDNGGKGLENCDILYLTPIGFQGYDSGNYVLPEGVKNLQITGSGCPLIVDGFTLFEASTPPRFFPPTQINAIDVTNVSHLLVEGIEINTNNAFGFLGNFDEDRINHTYRKVTVNGSDQNNDRGWILQFDNDAFNQLHFDQVVAERHLRGILIINPAESRLNMTIDRSRMKANTAQGIRLLNTGQLTTRIYNSSFIDNGLSGLNIQNSDVSHASIQISNTVMQGEGSNGLIDLFNGAGSTSEVDLSNSRFSDGSKFGICLLNLSGGQLHFNSVGCCTSNNGEDGILLQSIDEFTHSNIFVAHHESLSNSMSGIAFLTGNKSTASIQLIDGNYSNNGTNGVRIQNTAEANISASVVSVIANDNTNDGFLIFNDENGTVDVTTAFSVFDNNDLDGIRIVNGAGASNNINGLVNLQIYSTQMNSNGKEGLLSSTSKLGTTSITGDACKFNTNDDNGLSIETLQGGTTEGTFTSCQFNENEQLILNRAGVLISSANDDSLANISLIDCSILNNLKEGLIILSDLNSTSTLNCTRVTIQGTTSNFIRSDAGSITTFNLKGGCDINDIEFAADGFGSVVNANREDDDLVGTVTKNPTNFGVVNVDPDPFQNPPP